MKSSNDSNDAQLKPKAILEVHSANEDLFKMIGELQRQKKSAPIPVIDTYRSQVDWSKTGTEAILFLTVTSKNEIRFTCEGACPARRSDSRHSKGSLADEAAAAA